MRIEPDIDDELLRRALVVTKQTSAADAIRSAVKEWVRIETARGLQQIAGTIEFNSEYLAQRQREHP